MTRAQKESSVAELHEALGGAATVIVAQYAGSTVAQMTALRRNGEGVMVKVPKNTLVRRALEGTEFEGVASLFKGPTVMMFSDDVVAPAKVAQKFAKENERLVIVGGAMGATVLDAKGVEALAKMPSLDELRGTLIGLIQAPATKVAGVLQAPAAQLARVCGAYGAKE
ncbi:MAG: 50S ribosomal protein L10 [Alphaproteobacteria bacterium]|nr:50S ribosomal protein L10 [Alphaproteobacteria bacterium]